METRLQAIAERGVPNYFGAQRFGIGGSNLQGALRWAESGAPVRDRKRSFGCRQPAARCLISK